MTNQAIAQTDPRSPDQILADEAAAGGAWEGFQTENLLSEEAALQILDRRRNLSVVPGCVQHQPFRWQDKVFRILRCDYVGGSAEVEVVPHDAAFVEEIKKRLARDRFHALSYYQGFGFICFPEDYAKFES